MGAALLITVVFVIVLRTLYKCASRKREGRDELANQMKGGIAGIMCILR